MSDAPPHPPDSLWPDEQHPHDEAVSGAQIAAVLRLLSPPPRRVLDLGCGAGRVLLPLARAGHEVTGVDRNRPALAACRHDLDCAGCTADLIEADFNDPAALPSGPFDAVLCLGNTFMTVTDVDAAADLLTRIAAELADGGFFAIDDCPREFWSELTEGNWQSGIAEDGRLELKWEDTDAVFSLHAAGAAAARGRSQSGGVRRFRLWTDGSLRLAARAAGLSGPRRLDRGHLLQFTAAPANPGV